MSKKDGRDGASRYHATMTGQPPMLRVEFFGIPRARAGVAFTDLPIPSGGVTLAEVLRLLASRFPELAAACFQDGALQDSCAASLAGHRFVRDPNEHVGPEQTLLLLSADAGG